MFHLKQKTLAWLSVVAILLFVALPLPAAAVGQITSRALTLSTSSPAASAATTTYTFTFTVPSSTAIQSMEAVICLAASGSCSIPTGFSVSSATLVTQPTNLGAASGWSIDDTTAGKLRIKDSSNSTAPSGSQTVVFNTVQNPTTANQTFYAQINTYSGSDWSTGPIDSGTVAASTAQQITVSAKVDETLTFCTGTSGITSSSCAGATGSTVAMGTVSTSSTDSGTSQIGVTTNAGSGYAITINGTTLTSGSNTITALASQTASTQGSSQFGVNLKANTTPSVGSNPAGAGSGAPTSNYNTADQFRFGTGESIASVGAADAFRLFTVSYIANIANTTPPGTYTTTLTYICTATF